jgi:type III secretion protein C
MKTFAIRSRLARCQAAVVLTVLSCCVGVASAAEIPWRTKMFRYNAVENMKLRDFLKEFGASQWLTVAVDDKIEGVVRGNFELAPQAVLPTLATIHGLVWYYDGSILYVSPATDASSKVLNLQHTSVETLQRALNRLSITDRRYPIVIDREANTAIVSGPRRYVELVTEAAASVDRNDSRHTNTEVRVFPLKFAWAADYRFSQNGKETVLPGVASTLRSLYAGSGRARDSAAANSNRRARLPTARLKGLDIDVPTLGGAGGLAGLAGLGDEGDISSPLGGSSDTPRFQADGRMNAVLIRDLPERMGRYTELIRALDVRPGVVEIEVTIMDVSSDSIDELGIDWRLHNRRIDAQTGRGGGPSPNFGSALNETSPPNDVTPRGALLTALGGNAGRYLIARVRALTESGRANFVARPKILTLDNVEATLENQREFFVRVAGNQDVGLFNVLAGTSLRVTPLIVNDSPNRGVKLAIRIEDGDVSDLTVDNIPVVQRRAIGTQAFVNEGESLLIAGYTTQSDSTGTTGVPGLSSVPVIGALFRTTEKTRMRTERLYMLTPRLVPLDGAATNPRDIAPPRVPSDLLPKSAEPPKAPAAVQPPQERR